MARDEFKRQIDELQAGTVRGLLYYKIWKALTLSQWTLDTLNRFKGFFVPVRLALHEMLLIQFSKAFEIRGPSV